ncbi:MAG: acetyl-CoA carboxylase biotin carboxyl carrier protein subunit [Anaerolineales bacterium]|nr:acetyl-CoA carboxylase biotin carboxyl carrier protein subunit [Anaerolineales bacterium]
MKINFDTQTLEINPSGDNYLAVMDGKRILVEIIRVDAAQGRMDLRFIELSESDSIRESVSKSVYVSSDMAKRWVTINGHTLMLTKTSGAKQGVRHDHAGGLIAPMPGQVRSVSVSVGDFVKKGQTLLTMEAMKMEIRIQALKDGKVKSVFAAQGQTVEREQILIEMEE